MSALGRKDRRSWAEAYFAQAQEDLAAASAVGTGQTSVFCMLMQMVFEKLAKAAFLRNSMHAVSLPAHTHIAASRLILQLKGDRSRRRKLGNPLPPGFQRTAQLVVTLERLHPSLAPQGSPQLEYPWAGPGEACVCWPARHLPLAQTLASPRCRDAGHLLNFARALVHSFDQLFP